MISLARKLLVWSPWRFFLVFVIYLVFRYGRSALRGYCKVRDVLGNLRAIWSSEMVGDLLSPTSSPASDTHGFQIRYQLNQMKPIIRGHFNLSHKVSALKKAESEDQPLKFKCFAEACYAYMLTSLITCTYVTTMSLCDQADDEYPLLLPSLCQSTLELVGTLNFENLPCTSTQIQDILNVSVTSIKTQLTHVPNLCQDNELLETLVKVIAKELDALFRLIKSSVYRQEEAKPFSETLLVVKKFGDNALEDSRYLVNLMKNSDLIQLMSTMETPA